MGTAIKIEEFSGNRVVNGLLASLREFALPRVFDAEADRLIAFFEYIPRIRFFAIREIAEPDENTVTWSSSH
jgi:hypothetical protein